MLIPDKSTVITVNAIDNDILRLCVLTETNNKRVELYRKDFEVYALFHRQTMVQILEARNNQLIHSEAAVEYDAFIKSCEEEFHQNWQNLNHQRLNVLSSIREAIDLLTDIENRVIRNQLEQWKRDQMLLGIGSTAVIGRNFNIILNKIQSWFNELFNKICNTRTLIHNVRNISKQLGLGDELEVKAKKDISNLLQFLISSCFIIEKQPPSVIKKDSKFDATVRLLLPNLHNNQSKSTVTVSILSEAQAQSQRNFCIPFDESLGEILNRIGRFETQSIDSPFVICHLENMKLLTVPRVVQKSSGSVKNEKYALLFQTKLRFDNIDFFVWIISLPVAISVHITQDCQALGNITWDYAFSKIERTPFVVVDQVPWSKMAWLLQVKFESQTGSKLTDENLRFLFTKMTDNADTDPETATISWASFCQNRLAGTKFTFWDWFYAVMKLINGCIDGPWKEGLIIGFITKEETKSKLINCPSGTFLLRFSDSTLGGISPAWVTTVNNKQKVEFLKPFCNRDFINPKSSIADLIDHIHECVTLYPNIPKREAFKDYYTPVTEPEADYWTSADGYIHRVYRHIITMPRRFR